MCVCGRGGGGLAKQHTNKDIHHISIPKITCFIITDSPFMNYSNGFNHIISSLYNMQYVFGILRLLILDLSSQQQQQQIRLETFQVYISVLTKGRERQSNHPSAPIPNRQQWAGSQTCVYKRRHPQTICFSSSIDPTPLRTVSVKPKPEKQNTGELFTHECTHRRAEQSTIVIPLSRLNSLNGAAGETLEWITVYRSKGCEQSAHLCFAILASSTQFINYSCRTRACAVECPDSLARAGQLAVARRLAAWELRFTRIRVSDSWVRPTDLAVAPPSPPTNKQIDNPTKRRSMNSSLFSSFFSKAFNGSRWRSREKSGSWQTLEKPIWFGGMKWPAGRRAWNYVKAEMWQKVNVPNQWKQLQIIHLLLNWETAD